MGRFWSLILEISWSKVGKYLMFFFAAQSFRKMKPNLIFSQGTLEGEYVCTKCLSTKNLIEGSNIFRIKILYNLTFQVKSNKITVSA